MILSRRDRPARRALRLVLSGFVVAWLLGRRARRPPAGQRPDRDELDHDGAIRLARWLLDTGREELSKADTKASILLAAVAATLGVVAGAVATRRLPLSAPVDWPSALSWTALGLVSASVVLFAAAIYPRRGQPVGRTHIGYFDDVIRFRDQQALQRAIESSSKDHLEQLTDQLLQVSRIVVRKYRLVAAGMWALLAAMAAGTLALVSSLLDR